MLATLKGQRIKFFYRHQSITSVNFMLGSPTGMRLDGYVH